MAEYEWHTHEFGPLYNDESRVLILGSFPSVKSRQQQFFYGHPRNRFWQIMALLTGEPFPETVDVRRALALHHHIALWDVIESCEIRGSSDSSIRNIIPTNLPLILEAAPIRQIYTNGALATKYFAKYQAPVCHRTSIGLPSTSPANAAWSLERLLARWQIITDEL